MNDTTTAVNAAKAKVGRPFDPNSVLAKCKGLFLSLVNDGKTRPEILTEFQNQFGITKGTAQVYYHDSRNAAVAAGHSFTVKRAVSAKAPSAVVAG